MKIRNKNFINNYMTNSDIKQAFEVPGKLSEFVNKLLADGFITRSSQRSYKPTSKLINHLMPVHVTLDKNQRRALLAATCYYFKDLVNIFQDELIVKGMINQGFFVFGSDKRYRKADNFEESLIEGEDTFKVRKGEK